MNILVTGANGQLGQAIRAQSRCFQNHNIIFTDVIADDMLETILLDITSEDAIRSVCKSAQINVIINCAAYTDVEKAETDFEMANLINCDAVRNLATVAKDTPRQRFRAPAAFGDCPCWCVPPVPAAPVLRNNLTAVPAEQR